MGKLPSSLTRRSLLALAVVAAVVAIYYPVRGQPFANYDDPEYVTNNFHVTDGLHWGTIKWAFTTHAASNWHPVTWISHALDSELFGVDPAGPHVVNVVLHGLNALLLFWLLQRATGYIGRSWMVAALFAIHPMNVESVVWIAERKNLLSMFFFMLALAAYRRYARKPEAGRYLVVAVLFALGLMSKPPVIVLPFVLLLWDYWPLQRVGSTKKEAFHASRDGMPSRTLPVLVLEKAPLFAMSAVSAMLTLRAQTAGGATSGYQLSWRLGNALISYVRYLGKAVWPTRLALFYPYPSSPFKAWQVCGAILLLLSITIAVLLMYQRRYLTVGWFWFLGTLVPMIGVVQVGTQSMADRYAYLPFVGIFIMICWLGADEAEQAHWPGAVLPATSIVMLVALAVSHRQVEFWDDQVTLWSHTLEVTEGNWVAENNLGTALLNNGRPEEAISHFRAAAAINPADPNSNLNIGEHEQMHRNFPAAIARYKEGISLARNPKTKSKAYNNLGYAYKESGDYVAARETFHAAVKADPEFVGAWISLGLMAQRSGELSFAISAYSTALQIRPSDFGYLLLAAALQQNGEEEQAKAALQRAELISKNIGEAQRYATELLAH